MPHKPSLMHLVFFDFSAECNDVHTIRIFHARIHFKKQLVHKTNNMTARNPTNTGHRGYRGQYAENSVHGFRKGVKAGATVIELDVQVSRDGVVVVSHDENTKRCFGESHDITTTNYYGVLDQLQMLVEPHEHMPTLTEVASVFMEPDFANITMMIDIKRTNSVSVVEKIIKSLLAAKNDIQFWADRVTLGIWKTEFLAVCEEHAPQFDLTHIGITLGYVDEFLAHKQVKIISLLFVSFLALGGKRTLEKIKKANKQAYVWTVNDENLMRWARAIELDGVITDEVARLQEIIDEPISDAGSASGQVVGPDNGGSWLTWKQWLLATPIYYVANIAFAREWRKENAKLARLQSQTGIRAH